MEIFVIAGYFRPYVSLFKVFSFMIYILYNNVLAFIENANVLESHLEGLGGAWGAWLEGREKCVQHKMHLYEFNVGRNLQRKEKLG